MNKIHKGDNVKVMRGQDAGKTGEVLMVLNTKNKHGVAVTRVVVKGVNMVTRHQKPVPSLNLPGGIVEVEKPIDISNIMLMDPKKNEPTRVGFKLEDGKKVRVAKKSGTVLK